MALVDREALGIIFAEFDYQIAAASLPPHIREEVLDQIAEDLGLKITRTVAEEE